MVKVIIIANFPNCENANEVINRYTVEDSGDVVKSKVVGIIEGI